ncbi:hypothetical protein JCM11251_001994 [Rhodosporidiobolus azoricus]
MDKHNDSNPTPPSPPSSNAASTASPASHQSSPPPGLPESAPPPRLADRFKHLAGAGETSTSEPSALVQHPPLVINKPKRTRRSTGKCDRLQPCSNCSLRGLICTYEQAGPSVPSGLSALEANRGEISRLRREINTLVKALGMTPQELASLSKLADNVVDEKVPCGGKKRSIESTSISTTRDTRESPNKVARYASDEHVMVSEREKSRRTGFSPPRRRSYHPLPPSHVAHHQVPYSAHYPPWAGPPSMSPPDYPHYPPSPYFAAPPYHTHDHFLPPYPSGFPSMYPNPHYSVPYPTGPYPHPLHAPSPKNLPLSRLNTAFPFSPDFHRNPGSVYASARPGDDHHVPPLRTPISSTSSFPSASTAFASHPRPIRSGATEQRQQRRSGDSTRRPSLGTKESPPSVILPSPGAQPESPSTDRRQALEGDHAIKGTRSPDDKRVGRTLPSLLAAARSASEELKAETVY